MSNRNRNNTTRNASTSNAGTTSTPAPAPVAQTSTNTSTNRTTRRARKPVTIRVRSTGEEILRIPVDRSGYRVVRYEGYYHTVRGGGRTAPYIVGTADSEDMLGRA